MMRVFMVSTTAMDDPIRADAKEYYFYAYNLKEFGVFSGQPVPATLESRIPPKPDAGRTPGYPLFLVPFVTYPPTFDMLHTVTVTQAVLSSLAILIVFIIAYRLVHPLAALLCALFVAVSPQLITTDYYLLTESLFTFVLLVVVSSFYLTYGHHYRIWTLVTGMALGIAALIKPTMLYSLVFVLPATYLISQRDRTALTKCLLIALGFAVIYSPWIIRNLGVDQQRGLEAKSKISVAIHNGMYPGLMVDGEPESRGAQHRWDFEYNNYRNLGDVLRLLRTKVAQDPATYMQWYLIGKPITFFDKHLVNGDGGLFIYPVNTSPYHTNDFFFLTYQIMQFLHWGFIVAGLVTAVLVWLPGFGLCMSARAIYLGRFISIIFLYFLVVHTIANPLPRYSIPLRPEIYIMTMIGLTWLARWIRLRIWQRLSPVTKTPNLGKKCDSD